MEDESDHAYLGAVINAEQFRQLRSVADLAV